MSNQNGKNPDYELSASQSKNVRFLWKRREKETLIERDSGIYWG